MGRASVGSEGCNLGPEEPSPNGAYRVNDWRLGIGSEVVCPMVACGTAPAQLATRMTRTRVNRAPYPTLTPSSQTDFSRRERLGMLKGVCRPEMQHARVVHVSPTLWAKCQSGGEDYKVSTCPVASDAWWHRRVAVCRLRTREVVGRWQQLGRHGGPRERGHLLSRHVGLSPRVVPQHVQD